MITSKCRKMKSQKIRLHSIVVIAAALLVGFGAKAQQAAAAKDLSSVDFKKMRDQNFTTTFLVDQSPKEVFDAINNVRGWWSESIEGSTDKLHSVFLYHYKDVHICKLKIVERIPDKKVVWLVLDNYFNFTRDKTEWKGTKIIFDISKEGGKTRLRFAHRGLVPQYECYKVCHDAWTSYIQGSLKDLITTGKGKPNAKEGGLNAELIEKWGLQPR